MKVIQPVFILDSSLKKRNIYEIYLDSLVIK